MQQKNNKYLTSTTYARHTHHSILPLDCESLTCGFVKSQIYFPIKFKQDENEKERKTKNSFTYMLKNGRILTEEENIKFIYVIKLWKILCSAFLNLCSGNRSLCVYILICEEKIVQ